MLIVENLQYVAHGNIGDTFSAKFMECVMVLKTCTLEGDSFATKWNITNFLRSSTQGYSSWILPCLNAGPVYHPLEVKLFKLGGR